MGRVQFGREISTQLVECSLIWLCREISANEHEISTQLDRRGLNLSMKSVQNWTGADSIWLQNQDRIGQDRTRFGYEISANHSINFILGLGDRVFNLIVKSIQNI